MRLPRDIKNTRKLLYYHPIAMIFRALLRRNECRAGEFMRKLVVPSLLGGLMVGCATHPDTENFSREMIPTIVHKARCEARAAILEIAPDSKDSLRQTGVVMDFSFDLTENNNASTKGAVVVPINLGTFTIGWSAGRAARGRPTSRSRSRTASIRSPSSIPAMGSSVRPIGFTRLPARSA